ncbi:hypothetical protein FA09DRAFT_359605 [Tilletiopsis washingtonensis]|uniref:BZIP domain-containing protein n=1 Tax=Tilletiopsis washingtonensis TaxID=58919 RepID=A0A316ZD91_9BASI|nr:hypothetical protein FA09DRAFT_359605 [Tilletiopsis washingtonensis]PWN98994.1 hypothetical protein FA09DRAFT_359605 [Tilletiopsis washingtonensis]
MTRGRRPNLSLEPSRQLLTQRAFRERKAAHLRSLEEAVERLEAENAALRAAGRAPQRRDAEGKKEEGESSEGSSSSASGSAKGGQRGKSSSDTTAPSSTEAPEEWEKRQAGAAGAAPPQQQRDRERPFCEGCWAAKRNHEEIHTAMSTVDFHLATLASAMTQLRGALGRGDAIRAHADEAMGAAAAAAAPHFSPMPALRPPLAPSTSGGSGAGGAGTGVAQHELAETLKRWGPAPLLPSPRGVQQNGGGGLSSAAGYASPGPCSTAAAQARSPYPPPAGAASPPSHAGPSRTTSSSRDASHPYARPAHTPVGRASMLLASTREAASPSYSHSGAHHDVPSPGGTSDGASHASPPLELPPPPHTAGFAHHMPTLPSMRPASPPPPAQQQQHEGVQLQDSECCYGLFKCDKDGAIIA